MTWLGILIAVAVVVALFTVVGGHPRGGRKVEGTHLMTGARIVLLLLVGVVAWAVWSR
jgi:hypothetical protein